MKESIMTEGIAEAKVSDAAEQAADDNEGQQGTGKHLLTNQEEKMQDGTDAGNQEEEEIIRPYTLRPLKDGDLFPMLKIIRKLGMSELREIIDTVTANRKNVDKEAGSEDWLEDAGPKKQDNLREIGISVALEMAEVMITNMGKMESEIYTFWSELSGVPVEEMKEMEFGTLPLMIIDTFSEARNFAFFRVLSKFLK